MVNIVDNGGTGEVVNVPTDDMNFDPQSKCSTEEVMSVLSPRSGVRVAKVAEEEANQAKLAAQLEVRASRNENLS